MQTADYGTGKGSHARDGSSLASILKKYDETANLAKALWKRSWEITNSKEVLRLFAMNLAN